MPPHRQFQGLPFPHSPSEIFIQRKQDIEQNQNLKSSVRVCLDNTLDPPRFTLLFSSHEYPPFETTLHSVEELVKKCNNQRSPNSWMIFRMTIQKAITETGLRITRGDVSRLAGKAWRESPIYIQEKFKSIFLQVRERLKILNENLVMRDILDMNVSISEKSHRLKPSFQTVNTNQGPEIFSFLDPNIQPFTTSYSLQPEQQQHPYPSEISTNLQNPHMIDFLSQNNIYQLSETPVLPQTTFFLDPALEFNPSKISSIQSTIVGDHFNEHHLDNKVLSDSQDYLNSSNTSEIFHGYCNSSFHN
ncbi:hypothetical protein G9A89_016824 [Geosiphon pyriformis]|nr:hypothetical protein G9A89_016824 [Geosiphon pyriformis]